MTGETIQHYRVLRRLGSGGMGEVVLAQDTRLDRQVALKLLPTELARDGRLRDRFISEARAASALNHPNICVIHEVGESADGRPFIVMEFVEGHTLDAAQLRETLTLPAIVELAVQAADALGAAHAKGIVHRDIKPANLSLNSRSQLKILDFGLAKRTGLTSDLDPNAPTLHETQAGTIMGTPGYMSPEQALGRALDGRSDLFSLGIVLYQLGTGRSPFVGASLGETINNIVHLHPEPAQRLNPALTLEFDRIVRKCMEKNPEARYQAARELVEDLRHHLQELTLGRAIERAAAPPPVLAATSLDSLEGGPSPLSAAELDVLERLNSPASRASDIFISCAYVDDQPVLQGRQGWVSQFHRNLALRVEQLSGNTVQIWRHPNPTGDQPQDARLLSSIPKFKAMISVISPPFLKAAGCRRELEEFWHAAERSGTLRIDNKSRLFKVVKTPVDPLEIPPHLTPLFHRLDSYDFYEVDPQSGRFREYSEEFGEQARRAFLEKIYDLAFEVNQLLRSYNPEALPPPGATRAEGAGKVVFLAETTSDLRAERDRVKRELQERGFLVLPECPLPLVADELQPLLERDIARADAIIHMVGGRYGMIPEGAAESLVARQILVGAAAASQTKTARFIWRPPGLQCVDTRQAEFVAALEQGGAGLAGADLLAGTIEQLKALVIKRLTTPPPPPPVTASATAENVRRIYLLCDRGDEQAIEPLEDYLYDQRFEVKIPPFDGDEAGFEEIHQENLRLCDAVLVFFGEASSQWVEFKLLDLLKAPGYGRTKPWLAQAVYIAPPDHRRKERFKSRSALVLRGAAEFQPASIAPFVECLRV